MKETNTMALLAELSGWVGALSVLAGYVALSLGLIRNGRLFQLSNLLGSVTLGLNGLFHGAMPSVALNVAWATISAVALVRLRRSTKTDKDPDRPQEAFAAPLPSPIPGSEACRANQY